MTGRLNKDVTSGYLARGESAIGHTCRMINSFRSLGVRLHRMSARLDKTPEPEQGASSKTLSKLFLKWMLGMSSISMHKGLIICCNCCNSIAFKRGSSRPDFTSQAIISPCRSYSQYQPSFIQYQSQSTLFIPLMHTLPSILAAESNAFPPGAAHASKIQSPGSGFNVLTTNPVDSSCKKCHNAWWAYNDSTMFITDTGCSHTRIFWMHSDSYLKF